jgi:hypothetical protein
VSNQSSINRRTFISAAWTNPEAADTERYGEIASILVQAKPDRLTEVETAGHPRNLFIPQNAISWALSQFKRFWCLEWR